MRAWRRIAECWTCHTFRPGRDPVVLLSESAAAECVRAGHDVRFLSADDYGTGSDAHPLGGSL